jgi:hypothetical protein
VTSINIPKDDFAVREARAKNASTGAVEQTKETAAPQATGAIGPQQESPPDRNRLRQRRKTDRRKKDRRQKQEKVLLDTRSHQERRKRVRRKDDLPQATDEQENAPTNRGVDTYS